MQMRKARIGGVAAIFLWSAGMVGAQEKSPPPQPATAKPAAGGAAKSESPRVRQAIFQGHVLRQMTERKLNLSAAQKESLSRLFSDFVAATRQAAADQNTPFAFLIEGDWGRIEGGDTDLRTVQVDESIAQFVKKIKEQLLQPEQATEFYRLLGRWANFCPPGPRMGPLQQLRSAVSHPDMNLSPALKANVERTFSKAFDELRTPGQAPTPEKVAEVAEKTKVTVFEKLTPEQKTMVETHIRMLKEASEFALAPPGEKVEKKDASKDKAPKSPDDK